MRKVFTLSTVMVLACVANADEILNDSESQPNDQSLPSEDLITNEESNDSVVQPVSSDDQIPQQNSQPIESQNLEVEEAETVKTEEGEAQACVIDEDCTNYPWNVCGVETPGFCGHKTVFPIESLEIGGIIIFAAVMALSNVAGIGGGGVAIPIIMAMFNFTTKPAIAISSFTIFLTTVFRFIMNFKQKHPELKSRVSIDYDLVSIMMPTTLAGSQIGALILISFPSMYIQIMLTLLLMFLAFQGLNKAIKVTRAENLAMKKAAKKAEKESLAKVMPDKKADDKQIKVEMKKLAADDLENIKPTSINADDPKENGDTQSKQTKKSDVQEIEKEKEAGKIDPVLGFCTEGKDEREIKALKKMVLQERSHGQWVKQALCFLLLLCLIGMNLLLGSSSRPSLIGIERCSSLFWIILLAFLFICALATYTAVKRARYQQGLKLKYGGINVAKSDIRYGNSKRLWTLLILGFAGGWVAGALGLGGGSIYNPALLSMGVPPIVSSASGLYLVTFSTIASCLIYFLNGQLNIPYGLWIGGWSTLGMFVGVLLTTMYMKKTGRQSIIVWCLVAIFIISTIAIPIFGGKSLKTQKDDGIDIYAFNSVCTVNY